ncbi:MAG: aminomethyl-transferring glycine dehydrogenase subunit GcvPA [candidate division NC10 bacterium]|nr:aminomethyl-transferring glycine dehydrogenase subunit GcvPA [candidate division NC10 bacterium]
MHYIPNTDADCERMLQAIGVPSVEDLFADIPRKMRLRRALDLPPPMSEAELTRHLRSLADKNADVDRYPCFLGAGAYNHFIPAAISHLISRGEFLTSYTPYQPEVAQGTLQAIYEYQTLICQLTGMEVANASMYEGASSLAEAVLMAHRLNGRSQVLISRAVHPEYRQVVKTYTGRLGLQLHELPFTDKGATDLRKAKAFLSQETCCLVLQNPNFFGTVEMLEDFAEAAKAKGTFFIVAITEPISLGLLKPPGEVGADIVVGEGQAFGNHVSFGGPYLGLFATKEAYVRSMPGRLSGQTVDRDGKVGYVLTLSTREQHIRREKATSNICTNEGLLALAATIFLSLLGKQGLRELALQNLWKADFAREAIAGVKGYALRFRGPIFNEFVVQVEKRTPSEVNKALLKQGIIGGFELGRFYPELADCLLFTVTEQNSRGEIEALAEALGEIR